jgi:signal peptidase I
LSRFTLAVLVVAGAIGVAIVAAVIAAAVSFKAYYIPSASNLPTLKPGDRVLVRKGHSHLHRGDVIVFRPPPACQGSGIKAEIKRIVAVAGERVSGDGKRLVVDGKPATERYLARDTTTSNVTELIVPPGSVYALGDNRPESKDSRYCGPVPVKHVIGRAVFRVWPPSRLNGI